MSKWIAGLICGGLLLWVCAPAVLGQAAVERDGSFYVQVPADRPIRMELLDAERATVFLYDAERGEIVSRVAAGVGELRFPADRGVVGVTS